MDVDIYHNNSFKFNIIIVLVETQTKQSIEEIARQLLTFKIKGECEGEFPHPANQPREFAELVEYLKKQGYVC